MVEKIDLDKLRQRFTSADSLENVDICDGNTLRPTFVNINLKSDSREKMIRLLHEFANYFAWRYTEIPGLS
jgi:hypothetical protein